MRLLMVTYVVVKRAKLFGPKLVKVLVEVLVRQVGAHKDALDFARGTGQLGQRAVLFLLCEPLEQTLESEA